jgi:Domain of unknown function (DUF4932)/Bacterial Ig-like domain
MKQGAWTAAMAVLCLGAATTTAIAQEVTVRVDPRVELLSIVFRLAGNPEYGKGRVQVYTTAVEKHFGKFRGHDAVTIAAGMRRSSGVSYDAVAGMAVHLKDVKSLELAVPLDPWPTALDRRWTSKEDVETFLAAVRRFRDETTFAEFFAEQKPLYDLAVKRMEGVLAMDAGFDWFERFFGTKPTAEFTLALGMLNGGQCYGPRVVMPDQSERLYCILGVWQTDAEGKPEFTRDMLGIVAHEFCHSFVNPLMDRHEKRFEPAGTGIYPMFKEAMTRQAYATWQIMFKESVVRAAVIRYLNATRGPEAVQAEESLQRKLSFLWVPKLAELLATYEQDREAYPTLEAFVPKVVEFFETLKSRLPDTPQVLTMTPANGATAIDPGVTEIRVTFDRAMNTGGFSFVGGGPTFPITTGRPSWDAAGKVITLPVKLEPNHSYEFWLNRGRLQAFRSAKGVPLASVHVTFRTGPAR